MKKHLVLTAVLAATLNVRADNEDMIILADFQNPPGGDGAVNGTQKGLVVNLPEGEWIWAKGWNWGNPAIGGGQYSNSEENTGVGLPLTNTTSYVKPNLLLVHGVIWGSASGGLTFWSELEPKPYSVADRTPEVNATGVQVEYNTGKFNVLYNNGTLSPPVWVEPAGAYALDYAVDTESGELLRVIVNGELLDG
ncbi:MAG: hypothetical protein FWF96_03520, partial [Kiritimatiellaeota bacterium]|nr:hypothetical protein [Kiritimatiellota bacterium]